TGGVFEAYRQDILEEGTRRGTAVGDALQSIIDSMFASAAPAEVVVERDDLSRNADERSRKVFDDLAFDETSSPGTFLLEKGVLRIVAPQKMRFAYDRFFEFLIAEELLRRFQSDAAKPAAKTAHATRVITANLDRAQSLNTLFG